MECGGARGIWLVHVEEAAQVNAADVKPTDADSGVRQRLKLNGEARLDAVGIFVILVEANDNGRPKEAAVCDGCATWKWVGEWVRGVIRVSAVLHEAAQAQCCDSRCAGKSKKLGLGVESILKRAPWILSDGSAARRLLASQQRRRNGAVEKPKAGPHDEVVFCSDVVSEAQARVEVLPLCVEHIGRPGFPLPANAAVESEF